MFEDLQKEAQEVLAKFEASSRAVLSDADLTGEGKQNRLAALDAERRAQVKRLQQIANERVQTESAKVSRKIEALRSEHFESKRQVLGDAVIMRLYERQVQAMPLDELGALFDDAIEGFEKELVRGLVQTELAARGEVSQTSVMLQAKLDDAPAGLRSLRVQQRELADVDGIMLKLDTQAYRQSLSDAFNVAPDLLQVPLA